MPRSKTSPTKGQQHAQRPAHQARQPAWHGDEGETVIHAHGHQRTVEWSQLGSDSGFQDVRQLLKEIVTSLQEESAQFADLDEDKIMLQCPGSCVVLDPDATLAGDEGKATRRLIKKSGDLEV